MKKIYNILSYLAVTFLMIGCVANERESLGTESLEDHTMTLVAGIKNVKSMLVGTKVYWTAGDQIVVNGVASSVLTLDTPTSQATFTFAESLQAPYNAVFPASIYKSSTTVTLPAVQGSCEGSFHSEAAPMIAYADNGNLTFAHPFALVQLTIANTGGIISYVEFRGNASEQVCGDFTIDYVTQTLTGTGATDDNKTVKVEVGRENAIIYIAVPAITYGEGFTVKVVDELGNSMEKSTTSRTLVAGQINVMPEFDFVPDGGEAESGPVVVAEGVIPAKEIIPYNGKCLIIRGELDNKTYRMAYDESTGKFSSAEIKADWSTYVTLWLAKAPGNYLHFGNMYDTWATYNCGDDASVLPAWDGICDGQNAGVIVASASTYWPIRTGHPSGILGVLGTGQLLWYKLDEYSRLVSENGLFVHAYTNSYNFASYSLLLCYGYELLCIDAEGNMWHHAWDPSTNTYSGDRTQVGSGFTKFTHVIPWEEDLLARDSNGTLYRYKFDLQSFLAIE